MITGPSESFYEEGLFKAKLKFPTDFPDSPPEMIFETPIIHPNVYPDGKVCISILHPPGKCCSFRYSTILSPSSFPCVISCMIG
jgi:ubiquitin-conjugating enzyme E2 G2